jgi:S-formylglutathione hydrolase FrmB
MLAARTTLVLLAAITVFALPSACASGSRALDSDYRSEAIAGPLHFEVYLPPGYATSGLRYPVVYFLHGLPAGETSYGTLRFVERAVDGLGRPAILVVPQGARRGESDPEYVDHGDGDDWATAIGQELRQTVDRRYRTIASRSGRALIGVSAGGYGAMHIAAGHLGEFSVVESWSGYFHPTDPSGTRLLRLGSKARDATADVHRQLLAAKPRLAALPTFIAFYVGRADDRFADENERLHRELSRASIRHLFRVYPGGHEQVLWAKEARSWLGLALAHLAPAG